MIWIQILFKINKIKPKIKTLLNKMILYYNNNNKILWTLQVKKKNKKSQNLK
jgi:hypothetical protein